MKALKKYSHRKYFFVPVNPTSWTTQPLQTAQAKPCFKCLLFDEAL